MKVKLGIVLSVIMAVGLGMGGVLPSSAQVPILVEPLTPRSVFTDDVGVKFSVKLDGRRRTC